MSRFSKWNEYMVNISNNYHRNEIIVMKERRKNSYKTITHPEWGHTIGMRISGIICIAILASSIVKSKSTRLTLFLKYHGARPMKISQLKKLNRFTIREKVCNAKTCNKCMTILTRKRGMTKIKVGCRKLVALKNCCLRIALLNHMF